MYTQPNSPFARIRKTTKGEGRNFRATDEGAGMTEKGVKEYKKQNPNIDISGYFLKNTLLF